MENNQPLASQVQLPIGQLKESIRDMLRLQRDYQISDEVFWQIFNTRVLLNEKIDVDTFLIDLNATVSQA